MIVMSTPKGWTGPKVVDGLPGRGHVARASGAARRGAHQPRAPGACSRNGCARYRPEELFDENGAVVAGDHRARAEGRAADERQPARQRRPAAAESSSCPTSATTGSTVRRRRHRRQRGDAGARRLAAGRDRARTRDRFRLMGPDETASNRLSAVFEATDRVWEAELLPTDDHLARRRARDGGALRASVPGVARGLPADRPPRPVQLLRGVHPHHRLDVQPAREVAEGDAAHPVAPAVRLAQLPAVLACLAPGQQRLLPPGSRLHRPRREQEGGDHPGLPAARRQLPAVGGRPLPAQPRTTST